MTTTVCYSKWQKKRLISVQDDMWLDNSLLLSVHRNTFTVRPKRYDPRLYRTSLTFSVLCTHIRIRAGHFRVKARELKINQNIATLSLSRETAPVQFF